MDLSYAFIFITLDCITKRNRAFHTRDTERPLGVVATSMTNKIRRKVEERDEKMTKMMTDKIQLYTL